MNQIAQPRNIWRTVAIALIIVNSAALLGVGAFVAKKGGVSFLAARLKPVNAAPTSWQGSPFYVGRVNNFRALPSRAAERPVILLGDSQTAWGNWGERLQNVGVPVLTRGIVADTSDGVLARLDEVTRHRPRALFICVGVNDLLASPTDATVTHVLGGVAEMVKQVHASSPDTTIFLETVLPVEPERFPDANCPPDLPKRIRELNTKIGSLADDKTVFVLDLDAALTGIKTPRTVDGIHLLPPAYAAWEAAIRQSLTKRGLVRRLQ